LKLFLKSKLFVNNGNPLLTPKFIRYKFFLYVIIILYHFFYFNNCIILSHKKLIITSFKEKHKEKQNHGGYCAWKYKKTNKINVETFMVQILALLSQTVESGGFSVCKKSNMYIALSYDHWIGMEKEIVSFLALSTSYL
jgi:hypothetical protein